MRFDLPHELPDSVDWTQPIDWSSPLNAGLSAWFLAVPGAMGYGSTRWRDLTGRHVGTLTGMDPKSDWSGARGRTGGWGAMNFASGKLVSVPDADSLDVTTPFAISFWYTRVASSTAPCLSKYGSTGDNRSFFVSAGVFSSLSVRISSDGTVGTAANYTFSTNNSVGTTYHVTVAMQGTSLTVYKNGVSLGTQTAIVPYAGAAPLEIGGDSSLGSGSCRMDSVRVYRGRAFSAGDVAELYRAELAYYPGLLNRISLPFYAPEEAGGGGGANRRRRIICGAAA